MSGHNKWSKIKRAKGAADANRGQIFTKLTREIIVAVREGGSDPDTNFRLRLAMQKARESNMPLDNVERAIQRGSGKLEGTTLIDLMLEGYGPGGSAIMVKALTDNRLRTLQEVRNTFSRHGGNMGEAGSVGWLFDSRGVITLKTEASNLEETELKAIDAGADDVKSEDGTMEIYTKPNELEKVKVALEKDHIPVASAELALIPKTYVELEEKAAVQALKLLNKLEELDEVQSVAINANFSDAVIEKYNAES